MDCQERQLSAQEAVLSMEEVARQLVENALTAAQKWLHGKASACYCGLAGDAKWLRTVGRGHQTEGEIEDWWRVEEHLRHCLQMVSV